ncbi:cytochrome P450 [Kibdelosporangium phytohabitans]|uniref:Cytochrome n=1 Tax=Kibdelosporangium phytohabitans TaxID=860235 RepID=A0A0N9I5J8_9PSEU|nr:cytochrome P450 [Kibdelosporangium phytohabitans]ALG10937.1 cytochrome [Kibdelosporangium phytohabitans]MBE1462137.1 cytochrome P450 [Kibdelosporangium phytohabitans]
MTRPAAVRGMDWDDGLECWIVSDPVLARQVLNHPGFSSRTSARLGELYMTDEARREHHALTEFMRLWFVHTDGPEHVALRKPVQRLLSASYVRSIAPRITEIVDESLEDLARATPHDVVPAVAEAVSGRVMAHIVGVDEPPAVLHTWSQRLSSFIAAMYRRDHATSAHEVMLEMRTSLGRAQAVEGFPLDTEDDRARTFATWSMILFGGLETTASLLGSCVLAVLGDPVLWARVKADDGVEAIVESVLELRPPLRNVGRVVAEDFEFAGSALHEGDLVLVSLEGGALLAGDQPGQALTGCPVGESRQHLIFGFGSHYCVGAPLARLEAATTLRRFARRFPGARLADNAAVWGPNLSYVGLDHLYVDIGGS